MNLFLRRPKLKCSKLGTKKAIVSDITGTATDPRMKAGKRGGFCLHYYLTHRYHYLPTELPSRRHEAIKLNSFNKLTAGEFYFLELHPPPPPQHSASEQKAVWNRGQHKYT